MTNVKDFKDRINQLIDLANKTLATRTPRTSSQFDFPSVNSELFTEFRSSSLSFIINVYDKNHPYYNDFNQIVIHARPHEIEQGRGILNSIKSEIDGGWLVTLKGLVTAEIFYDFLEMADHLIKEGYKDPAAVMIGSVLEEHLRQLCNKNNISTEVAKNGNQVPKKADLLNSELGNKGIYNKLDQKSVTAWLDLRNKAAHGNYNEYTQQQVEFMFQSVTEFMARNIV